MVNKLKVDCLSVGRLCGPPIPHTDAHLSVHGKQVEGGLFKRGAALWAAYIPHTDAHLSVHGKQVEGGLFKRGAALWAAFPNTHAHLSVHGKQVEGGLFKHGLSPTLMHIVWTN